MTNEQLNSIQVKLDALLVNANHEVHEYLPDDLAQILAKASDDLQKYRVTKGLTRVTNTKIKLNPMPVPLTLEQVYNLQNNINALLLDDAGNIHKRLTGDVIWIIGSASNEIAYWVQLKLNPTYF